MSCIKTPPFLFQPHLRSIFIPSKNVPTETSGRKENLYAVPPKLVEETHLIFSACNGGKPDMFCRSFSISTWKADSLLHASADFHQSPLSEKDDVKQPVSPQTCFIYY
jgi:hypothetical protein